jgi:hypothetical protein
LKYFTIFFTLFFLSINSSFAENNTKNHDIWLTSGFISRHIEHSNYREINPGFGFEFDLNEKSSIVGGNYANSVGFRSNYFGSSFDYFKKGIFKASVTVAAFDGYPKTNNGKWFIGLVPAAVIEYKRVGANIVFVPGINRKDSAFAIQFKLKLN